MNLDAANVDLSAWFHCGRLCQGTQLPSSQKQSATAGSSAAIAWPVHMSGMPCCADESQASFSPGDEPRTLRMALKLLLEAAPRHVMVVLTGSSMSAAWLNTARMQASYSLLINNPGLDWPVKQSQRDLVMAWQALRNRHPEVPQELLRWSEPTSAALTKMALDWLDCGRPQNLQAFAADFTRAEFVEAVRALPPSQVLNFLGMQLNCCCTMIIEVHRCSAQARCPQADCSVGKQAYFRNTPHTAQGAETSIVVAISFHDPALRILQAHAEWAAALDSATAAERRAILRLAHPTCGIQMGNLEQGLRSYLWPFVSTSLSGVSWLTAPHHRQLLQVSSKVLCCPCCGYVWQWPHETLCGRLSCACW